ncbi:MAG: hypothetical protein ACLQVJ_19585 [Syntrophobacteraceae bacterium]
MAGFRRARVFKVFRPGLALSVRKPQAYAPSTITQRIIAFQDTGLAYAIVLLEIVRRTTIVDSIGVRSIHLHGFAALLFFAVCFTGSRICRYYEEKDGRANVL